MRLAIKNTQPATKIKLCKVLVLFVLLLVPFLRAILCVEDTPRTVNRYWNLQRVELLLIPRNDFHFHSTAGDFAWRPSELRNNPWQVPGCLSSALG
ncbi:hypothetical protein Hypma_013884 [Hypsizygus marmoreus]|uniref:Uncharacterized protein n=1 Tax=Hypsizygus marmoreus TaxID=39966 RepID=A0A369KE93_HYPMA|nr:hypothetical protein Hypma_013884 [Hypsizygus marmoreus]